MKIGITERGDAGLDLSWQNKLTSVDGAILITKNINDAFIDAVMNSAKPIIIHATCTGWGRTPMEPNVPVPQTQLDGIQKLIDKGFPADRIVLRVDPIIPCVNEGLDRAASVIQNAFDRGLLPGNIRVRVSVLDTYPHVRARFQAIGIPAENTFQASQSEFDRIIEMLSKFGIEIESCAEPKLGRAPFIRLTGCISNRDLELMGLPQINTSVNPQNRNGCLCLSCKTELLTHRGRCPHQCAYCYWKD